MKTETGILIIGGGLNGPALALALADNGLQVTVVDSQKERARSAKNFDGRGYALSIGSQRLLSAIGIWPVVNSDAQPILEIKVTDGNVDKGPSPWVLHFDHAEIEEGPMGFMLEDRYLYRALLGAMKKHPNVTLISGHRVTGQKTNGFGATAILDDGTEISANLLVGCDGRTSATAQRAGIKRSGWAYGQTALVCAIEHEHPHNGVAHQYFMPNGPLAILPLQGNRVSIVWSETDENAHRIQQLDDELYLNELRPRFGDFLGDISLSGDRFMYPLNLTLADRFVAERLALVGDAAHGVHPIAGQGLNLGFRDVGALAEVLVGAKRRGEDLGSETTLERYQQWRRWDTTTLAMATDGVNRLFSNNNSLLRFARDLGLGAVNAAPRLRRRLIREAAGLTGDLPKLMQGRQI